MSRVPFDLMNIINPSGAARGVIAKNILVDSTLGLLTGGGAGLIKAIVKSKNMPKHYGARAIHPDRVIPGDLKNLKKHTRSSSLKEVLSNKALLKDVRSEATAGAGMGALTGLFSGMKEKKNIIESYKAKRALLAGSLLGGTGLALQLNNKKTIDIK